MKILNWMQSKLNGKQGSKQPNVITTTHKNPALQKPRNDEFSDWPHGLLAIGTFGNINLKEKGGSEKCDHPEETPAEENSSLLEDVREIDFTPEEVGELQKELTKLLSHKPVENQSQSGRPGDGINLPLDKFLNCPSSLEVDRKVRYKVCDDSDDNNNNNIVDGDGLQRSISVVWGKGKDLSPDHRSKAIKKRSIAFLLKKMFVCRSGFTPVPSLRDPIPESRIEKLLRSIINKKIYSRSSAAAASHEKKYLENVNDHHHHNSKVETEEDHDEPKEIAVNFDGCKWVKTDTDYIVLEI